MPFNINSTVSELDYVTQASFYIPYWIYNSAIPSEGVRYGALFGMAIGLVYISSYATVSQPKSARDPLKDRHSEFFDPSDRDSSTLYIMSTEDVSGLNQQIIGMKSALLFPVMGAGMLYGLSIVLRNLDISKVYWLNFAIMTMLLVNSTEVYSTALIAGARRIAHEFKLKNRSASIFPRYRLTLSEEDKLPVGIMTPYDLKDLKLSKSEFKKFTKFMAQENNAKVIKPSKVETKKQKMALVYDASFFYSLALSAGTAFLFYWYNPVLNQSYGFAKTNWLVSNLVASILAIAGVSVTKVGNFKVSATMLGGLFLYDIYFVFASDIMVAVATGIELPLKLVFPGGSHPVLPHSRIGELSIPFSLLGLGDIVVPATFISLCLRYDYFRFYAENKAHFHRLRPIGTPKYFSVAMWSYALALAATGLANHLSEHGQPALLYIVPSLLGGVAGYAMYRGEFQQLMEYSESLVSFKNEGDGEGLNENDKPADLDEQQKNALSMFRERAVYEFEASQDETDDTYIIDEDTEEDEELYDDEDLSNEIDFLLRDQ